MCHYIICYLLVSLTISLAVPFPINCKRQIRLGWPLARYKKENTGLKFDQKLIFRNSKQFFQNFGKTTEKWTKIYAGIMKSTLVDYYFFL